MAPHNSRCNRSCHQCLDDIRFLLCRFFTRVLSRKQTTRTRRFHTRSSFGRKSKGYEERTRETARNGREREGEKYVGLTGACVYLASKSAHYPTFTAEKHYIYRAMTDFLWLT